MQTHTPFSAQTLSKKLIKPFLKIYADGRCSWRTGRSTPCSTATLWAVRYGPYPPRETAGDRPVSSNRYACPRFTLVSNHSPCSTGPGHPSSALSQPRGASVSCCPDRQGTGLRFCRVQMASHFANTDGVWTRTVRVPKTQQTCVGVRHDVGVPSGIPEYSAQRGHNGRRGRRNPI